MPTDKPIGKIGRELGQPIEGLDRKSIPLDRMLFRSANGSNEPLADHLYATMDSSNKTTEGRISPLIVEGLAPLDVLAKRLGMTQEQFCLELGIGRTSYQRWRSTGVATSLDHRQAKKLDALLRSVGLSIQDLPDDLTRCDPIKSA